MCVFMHVCVCGAGLMDGQFVYLSIYKRTMADCSANRQYDHQCDKGSNGGQGPTYHTNQCSTGQLSDLLPIKPTRQHDSDQTPPVYQTKGNGFFDTSALPLVIYMRLFNWR
jgi:hypothetical protein